MRNRATRVCFAFLTAGLLVFSVVSPQRVLSEGDRCGESLVNDRDVEVLKNASALIQRERGDTNQASKEWLAFQKFKKIGNLGRDAIEGLLQKATPAGRLYAVILLRGLDPVESSKVLTKMKTQSDKMLYIQGCSVETTTVGALAKRIINGEELVDMKAAAGGSSLDASK